MNSNVTRQNRIKRIKEGVKFYRSLGGKMGHLPCGMDPCIGAPCSDKGSRCA